ncbi:MAG TPA: PEP-utilizing enzyme [Acidimicrobiales bacterium]|nr:PEP-utilizing enzyme [Acidimicrobiales bacterium]
MDWRAPEIDADPDRTWMEGWKGPYPRLEQDWSQICARSGIACFEAIAAFTTNFDAVVFVNGYPYHRVPVVAPEELQRRRDSYAAKGEEAIDEGTDLWERDIRPEVERLHAEVRRRRPRSQALPRLVEHVEQCMEMAGHIMGDLHWKMAFGIPGDWSTDHPALTGAPANDAARFLQGIDHATSRLLRRLRHLARLRRDGDPAFEDEFAKLLERYGTRTGRGYGSASGFRDVTWSNDPSAVRELIDMYAKADLDLLDEREAKAKAARQRAHRRLRRDFEGTDVWPKLERAHRAAIARVKAMENHNHLMEQETEGLLRQAIHRLGAAMVDAGLIDGPDDVFHLQVHELRDAAKRRSDLRALVAERASELEAQRALESPPYLGAAPTSPSGLPGATPPVAEPVDGEIPGAAASPGRATGRARVVADTAGFPEVEPGDILVARDAGPAWTPVFALLGGLVLDEGWTIQHAAIVCRELGIPCVLATGIATSTVVDGTEITVDGDAGIVRLPQLVR